MLFIISEDFHDLVNANRAIGSPSITAIAVFIEVGMILGYDAQPRASALWRQPVKVDL